MVKVYFATDRQWSGSSTQPKWFNENWNKAGLTYGTCVVSIPEKHVPGAVEKPSIWKFEINEDPEKHVVVHRPKLKEHDTFFADLHTAVQGALEKEITIFIHGFNNTFDDAASRLGVLTYDMDFNGVPVLYSWPSVGGGWHGVKAYDRDGESVKITVRAFTQFLREVASTGRSAGAKRVNVVAHSMGNRALVDALQNLAKESPGELLLDEVVMAAPDIPAEAFTETVWPYMSGPAKRLTLYASDDDRALLASNELHSYRRIGQAGDELLLLPGLDSIDATGCDFSVLGLNHSYFGGPIIVNDLKLLFLEALAPLERHLRPRNRMALPYWLLPESVVRLP